MAVQSFLCYIGSHDQQDEQEVEEVEDLGRNVT